MPPGYYRFPTIYEDTVVFVSEDDLWTVSASGGIARRLTSNLGEVTRPALSPDGAHLAFIGREEGQPEVYVMPSLGGPARRLTYLGSNMCLTAGWSPDGKILFSSNAGQPFHALLHLYTVDRQGSTPQQLPVGPARAISYGPHGGVVIGRNTGEPAHWKRYRGGTVGQIWVDASGSGDFHPLLDLTSNLTSPMWIGERIYFISDHEGVGNLYSCLPSGHDLCRHTDHEDFYVRSGATDGRRIVYHAGADLYLFDPASETTTPIPVEYHSPQTQRNRRFVDAAHYLDDWEIHPTGQSMAISARGKIFTFANWEGAVTRHGEQEGPAGENGASPTGVRYRLPRWLSDGKRMLAVSDAGGEESFVVWNASGSGEPTRYADLDTGRPLAVAVHPDLDQIVFSNNRYELVFLDLGTRETRVIDRGKAYPITGFDWSPDGEWVVYSVSTTLQQFALKLWKASTGEIFPLTQPVLRDIAPAFDPRGRFIYFLSYRIFDPVYDKLHFDLSFPRGMRPYLITLQKDAPSPFIPRPRVSYEESEPPKDEGERATEPESEAPIEVEPPEEPGGEPAPEKEAKPEDAKIQIDLEGIEKRVIAFPAQEGLYGRILGAGDGRVLYSRFPIEGALNHNWFDLEPSAKGQLVVYNFEDQKEETLINGISGFSTSPDGEVLVYRAGNRLRVLKAGEKPADDRDFSSRKTGWLDLSRIKLLVNPAAEWRQMFREAWRLQRDQFWTPDMSQVDWLAVHDRYLPLVDRVASRSEFSDLMKEMQGELGTSHAYEIGGDYRPAPDYTQGSLAAEFEFDPETQGWQVVNVVQGDPWDSRFDSPLNGPGVNIQVGDVLLEINGQRLSQQLSPAAALLNQAGEEVALTVQHTVDEQPRKVSVRTLYYDTPARYRQWVEQNRRRVHQATDGRIGYVHIPDMGPRGYAEFHRGFLSEIDRQGLIVDVRFNGGGEVSSLILEKLARRRIGYDASRWGQMAIPYPPDSVLGPLVALTNEFAGSDGDIFSHGFKLMKLGPLLGKRTWGGVIGISPSHSLVDGTVTTQPEFSFWVTDVGWGIENYGTDPDIEVDITPQEYARGFDAQLERAIEEAERLLALNPPSLPNFEGKPSRALPRLPRR